MRPRVKVTNKILSAFIVCMAFMTIWVQTSRSAGSSPGEIVAVDAGHGGYDDGIVYNTRSGQQIKEKDADLEIARAIISTLRAGGTGAFAVRPIDRYMDLSQRARAVQAKSPDLFLSIHLSSTGAFNIYVTSVPQGQDDLKQFYLYSNRQRPYIEKSRGFAQALEQSIMQAFPGVNVSYMEIPLPLLDRIGAPAVMLECPGPAYFNYRDTNTAGRIAQVVANAVMVFNAKR